MFRVSPIPWGSVDDDYPAGSSPARLEEHVRSIFEPKPHELAYKFTNEELKTLCRTFEVKVEASKFNVLWHFYCIFKKRGSLEGRSHDSTLRLLMKAYKHYKNDPNHVYSEKEIEEILKEEWELRKAESVRFLKEQREKNSQPATGESDASIVEVPNSETTEAVVIESMPQYAQGFFGALRALGVADPQDLLSQNSEEGSLPTPVGDDNSMRDLDSAVIGAISTEASGFRTSELINSAANSNPLSEQPNTAMTATEEYQAFNKGIPVSSTQDN